MIEILFDFGLFLAKAITITVCLIFVVGFTISALFRGKTEKKDQIQIKSINNKYKRFAAVLERETLPKHQFKQKAKKQKVELKQKKKKRKKAVEVKKRVFVIDFVGDIRASAVESLREEITAVLTTATPQDEVLVRLESGGGMVHTYGLAASQLSRIKSGNVPLTVAVDKIAASGGYLMATVADRILAAPFAILGSIGVIAQLPNFNRFLKQHNIDYEQIVAGHEKRSLTMFGENTDDDRERLKLELNETHELFKEFVGQSRKQLDLEKISSGKHWYGTTALSLNLIDEIVTSDDYLAAQSESADLFEISFMIKKSFMQRMPFSVKGFVDTFFKLGQSNRNG
jgi:serine protease SohB